MSKVKKVLLPLLLAAALFCAGCGDNQPEDNNVIEPGTADAEIQADPGINDKGEATTLEDIAAAQSRISSYYFEQSLPSGDVNIFARVWYCDNKMKVVTSINGELQSESYYDYNSRTQIDYSPADSDTAIAMDFDPNAADAPDNPLDDDYLTCTLLGNEVIDRQNCVIVQTANGDKLWVSTADGFPMQVNFTDHFGAESTVAYRNIELNTVTASDVEVPADLEIEYLNAGQK